MKNDCDKKCNENKSAYVIIKKLYSKDTGELIEIKIFIKECNSYVIICKTGVGFSNQYQSINTLCIAQSAHQKHFSK